MVDVQETHEDVVHLHYQQPCLCQCKQQDPSRIGELDSLYHPDPRFQCVEGGQSDVASSLTSV